MISHYLVQDEHGLYYIRKGIWGFFPFYHEFLDSIHPLSMGFWSANYLNHTSFPTEQDALKCWEIFKKGTSSPPRHIFKILRKLT